MACSLNRHRRVDAYIMLPLSHGIIAIETLVLCIYMSYLVLRLIVVIISAELLVCPTFYLILYIEAADHHFQSCDIMMMSAIS